MQRSTIHYATILCSVLFAAQASAQSANPNVVWGVIGASIFHYNASGWTLIPPPPNATPLQVSAGADGTVWEVNSDNTLYSYTGTGWQIEPGLLTQVSVGNATNVWGAIGTSIFQWNGSAWSLIPTGFASAPKQVSVAMDGTVWAIDQTGDIYVYHDGAWTSIMGTLAQVSVGSASNIWGVNPDHVILQWSGSAWIAMPSPPNATAQQVSAGADGTVYAIDTATYIYQWSGMVWQPFPGLVAQISGGLSDRFFFNNPAVTTQGSWSAQSNASAVASGYLQDSISDDTLTFKFTGDSVALYRLVDPNGGLATLTVDGKPAGTFDFYFPQQRWQVPAVLDHLGAGPHTLMLTVSARNNPASTGHNIYIDTFAAPSPFVPSPDQQTAISRINFYRNLVGLPPAALNKALDLASQAAAVYNLAVSMDTHVEDPTQPNFVGVNPSNRDAYFGYSQNTSEDAFGGENAAGSVDGWIATVYHRNPILAYANTDIGFGLSGANDMTESIIDFGNARGGTPASRQLNTYPVSGQNNVSLTFGGETPSPLPAGVTSSGFPISLQISQPTNFTPVAATAATYQLTDSAGNAIPTYNIDATNDPNPAYRIADTYFMLPQQPLSPASTYNAQIAGIDTQGNSFRVAWSFNTIPNAAIVSVLPFDFTANSAWIQWSYAGPISSIVSTQVAYGESTAYGNKVTTGGRPNGGVIPNSVALNLTGLKPGTTYHLQITDTDTSGTPWTTSDITFTTPMM